MGELICFAKYKAYRKSVHHNYYVRLVNDGYYKPEWFSIETCPLGDKVLFKIDPDTDLSTHWSPMPKHNRAGLN